jgi:hypothetical protein
MSLTQRQMLLNQRRMAAELAAREVPAVRDEPVYRPEDLRRGLARITAKGEEDGQYKVSELWWDPTEEEWVEAEGELGYVEADAIDYMSRPGGQPGQNVRFWEHRGKEGRLVLFIDLDGGGTGHTQVYTKSFHYSGTNDVDPMWSISGGQYAFIEVGVEVRACSGHDPGDDHPKATGGDWNWSLADNSSAAYTSADWGDCYYQYWDSTGLRSYGQPGLADFLIQYRVDSTTGDIQVRIDNNTAGTVSCMIHIVVRVTHFEEPPDVQEIGNRCCHETDEDDWGDDEFQSD